jgi:hypothetical protein
LMVDGDESLGGAKVEEVPGGDAGEGGWVGLGWVGLVYEMTRCFVHSHAESSMGATQS